jgi:TRAP-type C4-dicarboxylate transport system permease small subunit
VSEGAQRASGALAHFSRQVDLAVEALTSTLLAVIVVVNGGELVARNFFNYSFAWAHEVNLLLATWTYFAGMAMVVYRKGDITVEYFSSLLPARARRAWIVLVNFVVLGVLVTIIWYCWVLMKLQAGFKTTGLGIPNPWFSAAVFAGCAVMLFHGVVQTLEALKEKA